MHATYTHAQHENIMDIIIVNYSTLLNICMQEPSKIECVPSYGVLITQRQLDEAENKSNSSTRLIRNLMSAYFSLEEVAKSVFHVYVAFTSLCTSFICSVIHEC